MLLSFLAMGVLSLPTEELVEMYVADDDVAKNQTNTATKRWYLLSQIIVDRKYFTVLFVRKIAIFPSLSKHSTTMKLAISAALVGSASAWSTLTMKARKLLLFYTCPIFDPH